MSRSYSVVHREGLLPTELTGMWGWILLRSPHQGRGSPPAPAPTKQRPGRDPRLCLHCTLVGRHFVIVISSSEGVGWLGGGAAPPPHYIHPCHTPTPTHTGEGGFLRPRISRGVLQCPSPCSSLHRVGVSRAFYCANPLLSLRKAVTELLISDWDLSEPQGACPEAGKGRICPALTQRAAPFRFVPKCPDYTPAQ